MRRLLSFIIALSLALPLAASASVCFIANGCTSTSSTPSFGRWLMGGLNNEYEFISTSSLNLSVSSFLSQNISQWTNNSGYITWPWTITTYGESTSTLTAFTNGLMSTASSSISRLSVVNGTTTNATSTNLSVSNTASTTNLVISGLLGKLLGTDMTGNVVSTTSIGTNLLTANSVTINSVGELSGGGALVLGGTLNLYASTSPTVGYITATSTTATSTFMGAIRINNAQSFPIMFAGTSTNGCPLYGCVQGDMFDGEWDFNGTAAINVANANTGPCASSGFFGDGNIVALSSDYAFFGFLNSGWTGVGCAIGNALERPESTLFSQPTGDIYFELASTSAAVAYKWYTTNTTLSMILNNGTGNLGISTSSPGSLLSIGNTTGINFTIATSSFGGSGGINLKSGCFAINNVCISGGAAAVGANPTASIGLSAVNGVAATFLRSDAAPALDQTIAPVMSGAWAFTNAASTTVAKGLYANIIASQYFIASSTLQASQFPLASSTAITAGTFFASNGAIGTPSVQVGDAGGLYRVAANKLGIGNLVSGWTWDGTALFPNTDSARDLGILATNRINHIVVNYASTTETDAGLFIATNAAATSTFAGGFGIGSTSPQTTFTLNGRASIVNGALVIYDASSTSAAAIQNVNWCSGNTQDYVLSANTTFNIDATSSLGCGAGGGWFTLNITQDSIGGRTVTWGTPGQLRWANGTTSVATTAYTTTAILFHFFPQYARYEVVASSTAAIIAN